MNQFSLELALLFILPLLIVCACKASTEKPINVSLPDRNPNFTLSIDTNVNTVNQGYLTLTYQLKNSSNETVTFSRWHAPGSHNNARLFIKSLERDEGFVECNSAVYLGYVDYQDLTLEPNEVVNFTDDYEVTVNPGKYKLYASLPRLNNVRTEIQPIQIELGVAVRPGK